MAMPTPPEPGVTVVVVTWNGAHLLGPCLDSLRAQTLPHHVLVVDNASTDSTADVLAARSDVEVLRLASNTGFAGGAQAALDRVTTPYLALLNNDAVAEPGWLSALVAELDGAPGLAAATSRILLARDGRINNAGGALTRWGIGYDRGFGDADGPPYDRPAEVAAFCGGAAALRVESARRAGGFATDFFLYYEDTDLSWRLRTAGSDIRYVPGAVVHHEHSATSDQSSAAFAYYNQRNQLLMLVRNAPSWLVLFSLARFVGVTLARLVRPGGGHTGRFPRRLRVLGAVLARLPGQLRERQRIRQRAVVSRRAFRQRWLGVESR